MLSFFRNFYDEVWETLGASEDKDLRCVLCGALTRGRGVHVLAQRQNFVEPLPADVTKVERGRDRAAVYALCGAHPKQTEATERAVEAALVAKDG